jgi:hypothetical protein
MYTLPRYTLLQGYLLVINYSIPVPYVLVNKNKTLMRYLVMFLWQALGLKFEFDIFVFDIGDLNDILLGQLIISDMLR